MRPTGGLSVVAERDPSLGSRYLAKVGNMRLRLVTVLIAVLTVVPSVATAEVGDLVTDYGEGGHVLIDGGFAHEMVVLDDGSVILAGGQPGATDDMRDVWVAKVSPDGSAVTEFPVNNLGHEVQWISDIDVAADGSLFVFGGNGPVGGPFASFVGKLTPDGAPDTTFVDEGPYPGFWFIPSEKPVWFQDIAVIDDQLVASGTYGTTPDRVGYAWVSPLDTFAPVATEFPISGALDVDVFFAEFFPHGDDLIGVALGSADGVTYGGSLSDDSIDFIAVGIETTNQVEGFGPDAIQLGNGNIVLAEHGHADDNEQAMAVFDPSGALLTAGDEGQVSEGVSPIDLAVLRTGNFAYIDTEGMSPSWSIAIYNQNLEIVDWINAPDLMNGGDVQSHPTDGTIFVFEFDHQGYRLSRFDADGLGRFIDDGESVHEGDIEWIAEQGVTLGCNPPDNTEYCPTDGVTRAEMASFLTRALDLPPPTEPHPFTDTAESIHDADIGSIWEAGITLGCNPPDNDAYCPDRIVTREQMASFLVRTLTAEGTEPSREFADIADSIHKTDIEIIGTLGITLGCNPPDNDVYCPTDPVTRAQMASFIMRAMALP